MLTALLQLMLIGLLALSGVTLVMRSRTRSAGDVVGDLEESSIDLEESSGGSRAFASTGRRSRLVLEDDLGSLGLFDAKERSEYLLRKKVRPILFAIFFVGIHCTFFSGGVMGTIVSCVAGLSLGYLYGESVHRRKQAAYTRQLEYFLPIVMERVVMGIEAGLDILATLTAVLELEREEGIDERNGEVSDRKLDPVTRLLRIVVQLTDSGLNFDQSLREVANSVNSSGLKHSFIHLALAHKEGGELMMPLRELSDSTQLYYQETVEEEIAKLPVKATLPLLFTFAGLIIFFITAPLMQVMEITGHAIGK